jgi:superfamily II DNA/RNA helicase
MKTFENLNLGEQLMKAIARLGFKVPTQIQSETIPLILKGKDVIGESATGSGKTLAFGAGLINHCEPGKGVQSLVLVPTRELAEQVKEEVFKLSHSKNLKFLAVYGGVSINPQIEHLKRSEIVIATPGRLLDHLERGTIDLSAIKLLVLDEADRMVEMGFIDDVERILRACPKERQTLLFSATMYGPAKEIAMRHMKNPEIVHATKMVDPSKLKQVYYEVASKAKRDLLVHLLSKDKTDLVMVFCNTRRGVEMVADVLKVNGIKSAAIHGGLNQAKRLKTIEMFHNGRYQAMVCTDVAARGIHIEGVTHVYNFDIPKEPSDYVHRIGRTARAGKKGMVINVLCDRDYDSFSRVMSQNRDFDIEKLEKPIALARAKMDPQRNSSRDGRDSRGPSRGGRDSRGDNRSRGPTRGYAGDDGPARRSFSRGPSRGPSRSFDRSDKPSRGYAGDDGPVRRAPSRTSSDRPSRGPARSGDRSRSAPRTGERSRAPARSGSFDRSSRGPARSSDRSRTPARSGSRSAPRSGPSRGPARSGDRPERTSRGPSRTGDRNRSAPRSGDRNSRGPARGSDRSTRTPVRTGAKPKQRIRRSNNS